MTDRDSVQPCQICGARMRKQSIKEHEKHCSSVEKNYSNEGKTSQAKLSTVNKQKSQLITPLNSDDGTRSLESRGTLKKPSNAKLFSISKQTNQSKTIVEPDGTSIPIDSKSPIETGTKNKVYHVSTTGNSSSKDIGLVKKRSSLVNTELKYRNNRIDQLAKPKNSIAGSDSNPQKSSFNNCDSKDRKNSSAQSKRIPLSSANKENKEIVAKLEEDKPKSSVARGANKTKGVRFSNAVITQTDEVEDSIQEKMTASQPSSGESEEEEIVEKLVEDTRKPTEIKCEDSGEQMEIVIEKKIDSRKRFPSPYHQSCSVDPQQTRLRSEAAHNIFLEEYVVPMGQFAYEMHKRSLVPCIFCERTFAPDRVEIHQASCIKRPR